VAIFKAQTSSCCRVAVVFGLIVARFVNGPARQSNGPPKWPKPDQTRIQIRPSWHWKVLKSMADWSATSGSNYKARTATRETQHRWYIVDIRSCPVAWQLEKVRPRTPPHFVSGGSQRFGLGDQLRHSPVSRTIRDYQSTIARQTRRRMNPTFGSKTLCKSIDMRKCFYQDPLTSRLQYPVKVCVLTHAYLLFQVRFLHFHFWSLTM